MSGKTKKILIITISVILVFAAFITIPKAAKKRISSKFHSTRATYEECLYAIEGYVPVGSPIRRVSVRTDFTYENESGGGIYKNKINITVFLTEEMRDCWNKQALLRLYPHDVKIRGLISSVKDQSGFGPWLADNMKDYTIYVDGHRAKVWDEIDIRYIIEDSPQRVYTMDSATFKVYCKGDREEYSYRINDNTLVKFEKTYPVYVPRESTWDPDKNKKGSSSRATHQRTPDLHQVNLHPKRNMIFTMSTTMTAHGILPMTNMKSFMTMKMTTRTKMKHLMQQRIIGESIIDK